MPDVEESGAARGIVEEGLREARAIGNPVARARHVASWAFRLSALEPRRAVELLPETPDDYYLRSQLLLKVVEDLARAGEAELEPHFSQAAEQAQWTDPDMRLRTLNALSEVAIEIGDRNPEAARELLRALAPEARSLTVPAGHSEQPKALACALVGEGLMTLADPEGEALMDEAERLAETLPGRDALMVFLAGARAETDAERGAEMLSRLEDPAARLEARLSLAEKVGNGPLRDRLLREAEDDALQVEAMRGPEALVRLGLALAPADPDRARGFFTRALEATEATRDPEAPQLYSLQITGVASALAELDREWAERLFRQAVEAAHSDPERVRGVSALVLIANEMSLSHPRDAAEVLEQAVQEALPLDAVWELAHVLDLVFRQDRSPYLNLEPARALVERILGMISDEDPRVPGVFGLPEVARLMLQIDPERGADLLRRWYRSAEAGGDADGMHAAALALHRVDEPAGLELLRGACDYLIRRVDCPSMGEFARRAAPIAPELALEIAEHIPDPRERGDARTRAAIALYGREPDRSLALIRALPRPVDRSLAFMEVADALLQTGDRPMPQPLLEDLP